MNGKKYEMEQRGRKSSFLQNLTNEHARTTCLGQMFNINTLLNKFGIILLPKICILLIVSGACPENFEAGSKQDLPINISDVLLNPGTAWVSQQGI